MTMVERYNEHPAPALLSVKAHLARIGAELKGILGNDGHTYGWHLSKARLLGTGKTKDKSLIGPANVPCVDDHAGCAIDISMDWPASGEWLEDVRLRCLAGELPQVVELIGDPDLIPGAPRDIKDACYASASTGWQWVEYTGQGHVTWAHVGIGRRYANDTTFGDQLLGGWSATGRIEEDDMATPQQLWNTPLDIKDVGRFTPINVLMELYLRSVGRGALAAGLANITDVEGDVDELGADVDEIQVDLAAILDRLDQAPAPGGQIDYALLARHLVDELLTRIPRPASSAGG